MKARIITRTILLVSLVSLFTDIASEMLYPVMPIYLRSINFSVLLILLLEGVAEMTAGLSKGYFGNLSDKKGIRIPFIRWGYTLSAISKPLLALFVFPLWVFFARTMDRLGKGLRTGARDALLSDETTKEHKAKVFGFHRSLDTVGAAIGPVVALLFLYFYPGHYKWLFIIAFLPGIIAVSLTLIVREKKRSTASIGKQRTGFLEYLKYWKRSPPLFRKLVIGLLIFTFLNSSDALLLLSLNKNGLSDSLLIGLYIFYNLVYALASYPMGIIADRTGMKKTLLFGLFLFTVVYFAFGFASLLWQFIILFLLYGIYAASTEGISKAWISNIGNKNETATANRFLYKFCKYFQLACQPACGFALLLFQFQSRLHGFRNRSGDGGNIFPVYLTIV